MPRAMVGLHFLPLIAAVCSAKSVIHDAHRKIKMEAYAAPTYSAATTEAAEDLVAEGPVACVDGSLGGVARGVEVSSRRAPRKRLGL